MNKHLAPRRIMIFGRPGSGKSTLANRLGELLGLPVFHLDNYFYLPNWQERPQDEFCVLQHELVAREHWIIEGCNSKSFDIRFARADLIIQLDFSRWLCLSRILWRFFRRDLRSGPLPADCPNRLTFWFLVYVWNFDRRVASAVAAGQLAVGKTVPWVVLSNQRDVDAYVRSYVVREK